MTTITGAATCIYRQGLDGPCTKTPTTGRLVFVFRNQAQVNFKRETDYWLIRKSSSVRGYLKSWRRPLEPQIPSHNRPGLPFSIHTYSHTPSRKLSRATPTNL